MDWARILAYVTGTVEQELLARIEYLATTCCFSFTSRAAGWSLPGLPFTPSSYNGVGPCCLVPVIVIHGGQYRDVGCSAPAAQALCRLLSARWPEARGRR